MRNTTTHTAGRSVTRAEARIQQLCCLGVGSQIVVPAVLRELHDYIPSHANVFFWCDDDGNFDNVYDERPDPAALLPHYFSEYYNRWELEGFKGLHMVAMQGEQRPGVVVLHRARHDKPFTSEDVQRLDRLSGFLAHALLHTTPREYDWVDGDDQGLIIARVDGRIEWLSPRARQLLFLATYGRASRATARLGRCLDLPGPVCQICARLGDIRAQRPATGPPAWTTRNAWGQFSFRAAWLDPVRDTEGRVSITLQCRQPLPVKLIRKMRSLSGRQMQVCLLMSLGRSYKDIAAALGITENTAISHSRQIYNKFAVNSRSGLLNKLLNG